MKKRNRAIREEVGLRKKEHLYFIMIEENSIKRERKKEKGFDVDGRRREYVYICDIFISRKTTTITLSVHINLWPVFVVMYFLRSFFSLLAMPFTGPCAALF